MAKDVSASATRTEQFRSYSANEQPFFRHPSKLTGVLTVRCADQIGIVSVVTSCIAAKNGRIRTVDPFLDLELKPTPEFLLRITFSFDPLQWPVEELRADLSRVKHELGAEVMTLRIPSADRPKNMGILVSKQDHCLYDLLYRYQNKELPVNISCVISNHPRPERHHLRQLLQQHGIPFYYMPTFPERFKEPHELRSQESAVLSVASKTDFLVLARYMQVLSGAFLNQYGRDVINIHHGLLPSFKGANPYKQAYKAGVKMIGATSHFVTEELDAGPIIEQMAERVSHRDNLGVFAARSQYLEKQCLSNAVAMYLEDRVLRYSNNRVAIMN